MQVIPRARVASALGVSPDALPPGDLPVTRLAERWLGYVRAALADDMAAPQDVPDFWTAALVMDLARSEPGLCLDVVLAALPLCRQSGEVALIAAGPLEDVIAAHGTALIDRIEAEAAVSARLRLALSGVWPEGSAGTALWARVQAARGGDAGLDDGALLPG
jgi:hypothetical protein